MTGRTPRRRQSHTGQRSIADLFSPSPKQRTEKNEEKEEEDPDKLLEPDEKKQKLEDTQEAAKDITPK